METNKSVLKDKTTGGVSVFGIKFEVGDNYDIVSPIGQGAYGTVVAAKVIHDDNATAESNEAEVDAEMVAIKKIELEGHTAGAIRRTLREMKLLRLLQHENLLTLLTPLLPSSREDFKEVYLVTNLMPTNLSSELRKSRLQASQTQTPSQGNGPNAPSQFPGLSERHCEFFLYQLLRGLKYTHSAGVLHRDLKPGNLLLNESCELQICDFGLARAEIPEQMASRTTAVLTDYITTRWYRAPEVMISWLDYTEAIDVWAAGCIFAEMMIGRPLFAGEDEMQQVQMIVSTLGIQARADLELLMKNDQNDKLPEFKEIPGVKSLDQLLSKSDPAALDLLKRMLIIDPAQRITVQEALAHPYLKEFHDPDDEPTTDKLDPYDFDFEFYDLNSEQLKDLLYDEIMLYHDEALLEKYMDDKIQNPDGSTGRRFTLPIAHARQ